MKNIFSQTKDYVKPPKRNVFDLTQHVHGTFNFGYLYPVFCKETLPGDSFQIDPTFALRFLPTAFPVQTRVTANLHFFYVRNRNLWENWKKFIGHVDDSVEFPYLDGTQDCIKTSGLADYLGVPTTVIGGYATTKQINAPNMMISLGNNILATGKFANGNKVGIPYDELFTEDMAGLFDVSDEDTLSDRVISTLFGDGQFISTPVGEYFEIFADTQFATTFRSSVTFILSTHNSNTQDYLAQAVFTLNGDVVESDPNGLSRIRYSITPETSFFLRSDLGVTPVQYPTVSEAVRALNSMVGTSYDITAVQTIPATSRDPQQYFPARQRSNLYVPTSRYIARFDFVTGTVGVNDISSVRSASNPFIATNNNSIRLNALPFRAYESIYNAFYRNDQNDPLMINGKPEYDKYVPNISDGADSYSYRLYKRNWELDFLTSAVQSPQQGIAPLVGVSQSGDFTFVNKDDNGNIGYFTAKAQIGSDGESITGFQLSDQVVLDGVPNDPSSAASVPDSVKSGTVYSLNQMALAGISINDFRNVNALQRWLETNIRRGYKYKDQIKSHYGVDIAYSVLDMPEFIGGVSQPVFSSQVNQTVETSDDPLGSYAGQLSLISDAPHKIRHYCDEHGFIIGILSIVPVPNYSQLLPKHFIKYNYLDYYFPEFGHIGMQPIDYREVCPLQAYGVNPSNLSKTFGYQRPWYDYISSVDEVHGLFRTNLRNFVLNRQFDVLPRLNADFLQVDPQQLNDIFTVTDVDDKILGQILFRVTAKRPIPKFGIPRLE